MKEELNIDNVLSFLLEANNSLTSYIDLRKKYPRIFDFDDEEFSKLKSSLINALLNYSKYIVYLHELNDFNDLKNDITDIESLNELVKKDFIKPYIIDELNKIEEKDQLYYFRFIELVFDKDYANLELTTRNNLCIHSTKYKYLNEKISDVEKFFLITNSYDKKSLEELLTENEKEKYLSLSMEAISEANDKYSRVSNVESKLNKIDEDNIEHLYELVKGFKIYCSFIFKNNNSFNFDINWYLYIYNIKKYCYMINKKTEDIDVLLKYYKNHETLVYALKNELGVEDLTLYSKLKLQPLVLEFLLVHNVSYKEYTYLQSKGFNDVLITMIVELNGSDYTKFNVKEKYYCLLPYLSITVINSFTDEVGDYLLKKLNEIKEVFNDLHYEEYFLGYIKILRISNIKDYLKLLTHLDFEQVKIYDNIARYTKDNNRMTSDDIARNVSENIEMYENADSEDLIYKIPLMLDAANSGIILDELKSNGLDVEHIEHLDSTIFCYPSTYVIQVIKILKSSNVDIILENKLNPNMIKYITQIIQNQMRYDFPPPIIRRPNKKINK